MKTKIRFILLSFVSLLLFQCDDESKRDCTSGTFVKNVIKTSGIVHFDTKLRTYVIQAGVPGTYDSVDIGLPCNLSDELRKDNLQVVFDGSYYEYKGPTPEGPVGLTYYYLDLHKVTQK